MPTIFLCTPTSGTASMLRILRTIGGAGLVLREARGPASLEPAEAATFLDRKAGNVLYWFRGHRHWRGDLDLSDFRVVGHYRDPRDLACNQFWWALQHPNTTTPPELLAIRRKKIEAAGIDHYALGRSNVEDFQMLMALSDGPRGTATTWTSYNQLCCAFDLLTDNLCRMFNRAPSQVAEALRIERPENLGGNPDWVKVGGTWMGSDVTPGRFRRDLKPETVAAITEKHATELAFCRLRDADFLRHHYS